LRPYCRLEDLMTSTSDDCLCRALIKGTTSKGWPATRTFEGGGPRSVRDHRSCRKRGSGVRYQLSCLICEKCCRRRLFLSMSLYSRSRTTPPIAGLIPGQSWPRCHSGRLVKDHGLEVGLSSEIDTIRSFENPHRPISGRARTGVVVQTQRG
jgi:hypothetical protein